MQTGPMLQFGSMTLALAGTVVAVLLLGRRAWGRARVLGVIGTVLLLLGTLSTLAYRWLLGPLLGEIDEARMLSILSARTVIGSVLAGAGLILLSCAIISADRPGEGPGRRPR